MKPEIVKAQADRYVADPYVQVCSAWPDAATTTWINEVWPTPANTTAWALAASDSLVDGVTVGNNPTTCDNAVERRHFYYIARNER